jgi:SagB-type dehydrogenase family enzyme
MSRSLFLSLRDGVSCDPGDASGLVLRSAEARVAFKQLSVGCRDALRRLCRSGEDEGLLAGEVLAADGVEGLARFYYCLQQLGRPGWIRRSARQDHHRLATLVSFSSPAPVSIASRPVMSGRRYQLSRFAYIRRARGEMVLESPLAHSRVVLHDRRAMALVHALAQPGPVEEQFEQIPGLAAEAVVTVMTLLLNADMLCELDEDGSSSEDRDPALQCWDFHDLLFHARSRSGRHDYPSGGTYRFAGLLDPTPALKEKMSADVIDLHRPDLERLVRDDPPLALVQERRHSVRRYGSHPISARQLGEFLYRVGRVKEIHRVPVETLGGLVPLEVAPRPYPGGGGMYELELYVTANACSGLSRGLYHYDPQDHRLERLNADEAAVDALLRDAAGASGIPPGELQVLITIAARFSRVSWKYAGIAYALTLKHVGVLYQTMYLVATAMGLAPCGLGGGDSDCFARAAGTDYFAETSVGEFLLGSRPREAVANNQTDV